MIAYHKMFLAIELHKEVHVALPCKVSNDIHLVFFADPHVPVGDKDAVHLFNILEWPVAVAHDVRVIEV